MVGDRLGDVQSVGATPLFFSIAWTVRPQGFAWPEGLIAVPDSVVGHGARTVRLRVLQRAGRSAGGAASGGFAQPDGMDATLGSVAEPGACKACLYTGQCMRVAESAVGPTDHGPLRRGTIRWRGYDAAVVDDLTL